MQDLLRKKIYKAIVVAIKRNKVIVNANLKCLYSINSAEFNEEELKTLEGKELPVFISNLDPVYNKDRIASYKKAKNEILWLKIVDMRRTKQDVKGKVLNSTRGGFNIQLECGVNAFLPTSHVSEEAYESDLVGKTIDLKIIGTNKLHRNIIVSRKEFVVGKLEESNKDKMEVLSSGVVLKCIVKSISEHGLFVSLGYGYLAIIPASEASWGSVSDLYNIYHVGQHLEAMVCEVDSENRKVVLSINKTGNNPFVKLTKGTVVQAIPVRILKDSSFDTNSSASQRFTVLYKMVDNLIMCKVSSEDERYDEATIVKNIADKTVVEVTIKSTDPENRIIMASTRRSKKDSWDAFLAAYNAAYSQVLPFRVKGKSKFMLFLAHEDYETVLTINEVACKNTAEVFNDIKVGDKIQAKVIHIEYGDQKVYLSRRALEDETMSFVIQEILEKESVTCKAIYNLGYRKYVVSVEGKIDVVVDSSKLSMNTVNLLRESFDNEFIAAIESYQSNNHHLELSEHKLIKESKAKKSSSPAVKDIMISDLIENFSSIMSEIGGAEGDLAIETEDKSKDKE